MSDPEVRERLEDVKRAIGSADTTGLARKFWESFEAENRHRLDLVLRLAEALASRQATITCFFLAYVYSRGSGVWPRC